MRGGTRYAPVWGATDCYQKNVYALCGRGNFKFFAAGNQGTIIALKILILGHS